MPVLEGEADRSLMALVVVDMVLCRCLVEKAEARAVPVESRWLFGCKRERRRGAVGVVLVDGRVGCCAVDGRVAWLGPGCCCMAYT